MFNVILIYNNFLLTSLTQFEMFRVNRIKTLCSIARNQQHQFAYTMSSFVQLDKKKENNIENDQLKKYAMKVGITTGKLMSTTALVGASTIASAYGLMNLNIPINTLTYLGGTCWVGSAVGSIYHAYQFGLYDKTEKQRLRHAYMMHALMGVTISPSLLIFHEFIPHAMITTGALIAGPITAARMASDGAMLNWGSALYTSLWGTVGIGFSSIICHYIGLNELSSALHNVDLFAGVALFTVLNAYNTHVIVDDFNKGKRDELTHSVNYSLNCINIFIRLLEIFAKTKNTKSK